jgi:hypothetical protein
MATQQDVFAEQEALKRRRALMDAMQQQNMQGQIVGDTGLGQALAKLGTAYVLRNGQRKVDQESATNRDRYQTEMGGALEKYLNQRNGAPQQPANEMGDEVVPGTTGDPKRAILSAMSSKFPELQAIGRAEFGQLGKDAEFKEHLTQDGTVIRTYKDGRVQKLGNYSKPKDQFTDPYMTDGPTGKILVKRNLATNEVEPVDKGMKVTTHVDVGSKETLKRQGEVMEKARNDQLNAIQARQGAEQILALSKDPEVVTGFGAGPVGGLQSLAAKLGFTDADGAAKTQSLLSALAAGTLEASKDLKGAISEKEKPFLEQAKSGSMNYTPEAIQHLANLAKAVAHNQMLEARRQWTSANSIPGGESMGSLYPQPDFGEWTMDEKEFPETAAGRVRYNPALSPLGAGGAPQPAGKGTPRSAPVDNRIKFNSLPGG